MDSLNKQFLTDTASVPGRLHTEKFVNNQDGYFVVSSDEFIIGVVSDGCSGSPHSEVGSYLVPRLVVNAILDRMSFLIDKDISRALVAEIMEDVRLDVSSYLRGFASQLGESMWIMQDCLLATAIGFVMLQKWTWFFSIGDGMAFVNDAVLDLDNTHADYPDMLVYGAMNPDSLRQAAKPFTTSALMPTASIKHLAVTTDGIEHFINAEGEDFPGRKDKVPSLEALWKPQARAEEVFKKLAKTVYRSEYDRSLDIVTQKVFKSPLLDDTTIIILKRSI